MAQKSINQRPHSYLARKPLATTSGWETQHDMLLIQSVWMQGETFLQNVKVIKLCWEWQFHWFWLLVSVESSLLSFGRDLNTDVLTLHALLHFTQLFSTTLGVADSIGFLHKICFLVAKHILEWNNYKELVQGVGGSRLKCKSQLCRIEFVWPFPLS